MVADVTSGHTVMMTLKNNAVRTLLFALLLFCLQPGSVAAVEMEVSSPPVIIVGGDRDYPPYEFLDKNGQPAGTVVLSLADEGLGIASEHIPQLTDPFFTTRRESGGTGLGLSVSATIAKEHNGLLEFDSAPGVGTTVTLPSRPLRGTCHEHFSPPLFRYASGG